MLTKSLDWCVRFLPQSEAFSCSVVIVTFVIYNVSLSVITVTKEEEEEGEEEEEEEDEEEGGKKN